MKRIIINKPKVFLFLFIIFMFNSGLIIKKDETINLMREEEAIIDVYTVKRVILCGRFQIIMNIRIRWNLLMMLKS